MFRGILSVLFLVAANLYPLYGVRRLGWDPALVIVLYWTENLILGGYNILKMATAKNDPPAPDAPPVNYNNWTAPSIELGSKTVQIDPHSKKGMIGFFCLHYGFFCFCHGIFVTLLVMAWHGRQFHQPQPSPESPEHLDLNFAFLPGLLAQVLGPALLLVASHGVSFIANYVMGGECRRATLIELLWKSYPRMAILRIGLLGGSIFVFKYTGSDGLTNMVCVLIALKILVDLVLHLRSHRRAAGTASD